MTDSEKATKAHKENQPLTAATFSRGLYYGECASDTEQAPSLPQTQCRASQATGGPGRHRPLAGPRGCLQRLTGDIALGPARRLLLYFCLFPLFEPSVGKLFSI